MGTYLAALTGDYAWYSVAATHASYLVHAKDMPPPSALEDPAKRPAPAEFAMIVKVDLIIFFGIAYPADKMDF